MGRSAVARFLLHLQLTFKKTLHAAEQERPDVKAARTAWREMQKSLDPQRLVFYRLDLSLDQHDAPLRAM